MKPKRVQRLAALDFGAALDHALVCATGSGLSHCVEPGEQREPTGLPELAGPRPVLTIHLDQGSTGFAWYNWAAFEARLCILALWDPSHRAWNDMRLSVADAGMWPYVLVWTVCLNCFHGPWNGAAFWEELKEAARLFAQRSGPQDPLLAAFLPRIMEDRAGDLAAGQVEVVAGEVFDTIKAEETWSSKGPKVALGRWFHFLEAARAFDRRVSLVQLLLCFLGLQQGWVSRQANGLLAEKLALAEEKAPPKDLGAKAPVKSSTPEVGALRSACKNNVHTMVII